MEVDPLMDMHRQAEYHIRLDYSERNIYETFENLVFGFIFYPIIGEYDFC